MIISANYQFFKFVKIGKNDQSDHKVIISTYI